MSRQWDTQAESRRQRLQRAAALAPRGRVVAADDVVALLEAVIEPGDRVCLEGNNQKQADFLARCLTEVDPTRVHDLHMVQSVLSLPAHLDVFERGIAKRLDFSFSGPQAARLAGLVSEGRIEIGAIHTYLELFGRYFIDLTPRIALVTAQAADRHGNLYTGPNTEDTPVIVEATAFKGGIVIAQVNEILDTLPRVDIPADWVDFVTHAPKPNYIEPLFTRDPAQISEIQVLMAMMAIKGIYAEYGVDRLNHGIGFDTAAIELLLPTYAESLGLKGKICRHWALNPHPALIPAIESGFVQSVHSFGSELGMEKYIAARPDVFFTGADGSMRSNRALSQTAGLYACDMFIGSTLQIDLQGNSSTATRDRIAGFGVRRIWARMRVAAAMPAPPGSRPAVKPRGRARCRAGASWWCRWWKPSRTHGAGLRRQARCVGAGRARQPAAAAGDDLRRRRQPCAHRRRHRQSAAVPHAGRTRAGDSRRVRLHHGRPGPRQAHGGKPARPRGHQASR